MRTILRASLLAACGLVVAVVALAQSVDATGHSNSQSQATVQNGASGAQSEVHARADADVHARADASKLRASIEQRAKKCSERAKSKAESRLDAASQQANANASATGDARVAARLAAEFGGSAEAMMQQKTSLGASWGELMIAHSLSANLKQRIDADDLVRLHQDHMGWGQIAAGLGLELGSVVRSVDSEAHVAAGTVRADGKVAAMRGDGARGIGVGLQTGVGAQAGKGGVGVGAGAGAGLGLKIGH